MLELPSFSKRTSIDLKECCNTFIVEKQNKDQLFGKSISDAGDDYYDYKKNWRLCILQKGLFNMRYITSLGL